MNIESRQENWKGDNDELKENEMKVTKNAL